jgi:hypothetical protein
LAVAAANPSSVMQRIVSSMILARVSSPRLRGAVVRRVGLAERPGVWPAAMDIVDFIT